MKSAVRESIARMDGYVPGEQPRDRSYVKLNTNENPYPPSPQVVAALAAFSAERLRLYPDPLCTEIRDTVAAQFGLEDREWVLCGNGSDDLLTIALRTFVDQGGRVAYTNPSYSLYPVLADIQGAAHAVVELDDAFGLPEDVVAQAGNASLLLMARPNAPTGNAFPKEHVEAVCSAFPGVVWIDEAYADFAADNCLDLVRSHRNVVVSRTLSKSYGLAGLRLGYACAHPDLISQMFKVKDSYNVNMLTQVLGLAALRDRAYMERTVEQICRTREIMCSHMRFNGFEVLPSEANFVMARPPIPAQKMFADLKENGFLVRYFNLPRVHTYIRVTVGTSKEMGEFTELVECILARY